MMIDFDQIADRISAQDNRGTSHPLFCVYEIERIYGVDTDYHTDYHGVEFEYYDEGESIANFIERPKFVNAHFTEASAQEYIDTNTHNLTKPYIYVSSLYRCPEMIAILEFLGDNGKSVSWQDRESDG